MSPIHKHTACVQYLQTFEAKVIFETKMLEVFTLTFASNVCKYCTQDSNKLYVYEKCWYSHMGCTLFYENRLDITWEKLFSLPWIELLRSVHPSKQPRDIATLQMKLAHFQLQTISKQYQRVCKIWLMSIHLFRRYWTETKFRHQLRAMILLSVNITSKAITLLNVWRYVICRRIYWQHKLLYQREAAF